MVYIEKDCFIQCLIAVNLLNIYFLHITHTHCVAHAVYYAYAVLYPDRLPLPTRRDNLLPAPAAALCE